MQHSFAHIRILPYPMDALYRLVLDIPSYPHFVPWCTRAQVHSAPDASPIVARLTLSFMAFTESYTSHVTMDPPCHDAPERGCRIQALSTDGPFRRLETHWFFVPCADAPHTTRVECRIACTFRNRLVDRVLRGVMHHASQRLVAAFEARAAWLYGRGIGSNTEVGES